MRNKIEDALRVSFAFILFAVGYLNLKNFRGIISPLDITYETFFEPLLWIITMALGAVVFAGWVKRQFRS